MQTILKIGLHIIIYGAIIAYTKQQAQSLRRYTMFKNSRNIVAAHMSHKMGVHLVQTPKVQNRKQRKQGKQELKNLRVGFD